MDTSVEVFEGGVLAVCKNMKPLNTCIMFLVYGHLDHL